MKNFLDKFFFRSKNLDQVSQKIKKISLKTPVNKIFEAINDYSNNSEIRYVGGCVRKALNNETIDDIDLATNLIPSEVCDALKKKEISYYETGIDHGTITAVIDEYIFEITSLRKDVSTDGRHATVKFSLDWKEDASRRDFTINSIYSDLEGNLFDPFNGRKDLEKGSINFIGDPEKRIQEDYLRILRYIRFFSNYSKQKHQSKVLKIIKKNIEGISNLSSERLISELKKITSSKGFNKIFSETQSLELIEIIFPQLKNIQKFKKLNSYASKNLEKIDFIFLMSLLVIDGTDNADYFLYKFKISKKDQKRLKIIDLFYREKVNINSFNNENLNRIFYFKGKQAVTDIINFKLFNSTNVDKKLIKLINIYKDKITPILPIKADLLMTKYNIPEGKTLGTKLKIIEETWVQNGFQISDKQIQKIAKS